MQIERCSSSNLHAKEHFLDPKKEADDREKCRFGPGKAAFSDPTCHFDPVRTPTMFPAPRLVEHDLFHSRKLLYFVSNSKEGPWLHTVE